jgi:hypothetical protein
MLVRGLTNALLIEAITVLLVAGVCILLNGL